uniref:Uncharacterized protein n=1 Tax=Triticum urartu TaxID=4572 RepID=A0A8R7UDG2_TRIUA
MRFGIATPSVEIWLTLDILVWYARTLTSCTYIAVLYFDSSLLCL